MKNNSNNRALGIKNFSLVVILLDVIIVSISWIGAFWLRYLLNKYIGVQINPYHIYLISLPHIVALWIAVSWSFGLYKRKKRITKLEDFHSFMKSIMLGSLLVMSYAFLSKGADLGRLVVFFFIGLNFFLLGISRVLVRKIEDYLQSMGYNRVATLIIGAGEIGLRAMQKLQDHPETGYDIVGFLDDDPKKQGQKIGKTSVLGRLSDIKRIIEKKKVEEVFIAIPSLPHNKILELIVRCEFSKVNFKVVTDLFDVISGDADFDVIEDFPIVELKDGSVAMGYEPGRRIFDLAVASILLILSLPVWLIIIIIIRLDSKGPPFFCQDRVGKNGRIFKFYKFRTMFCDVGAYEISPRDSNDKRITRVGNFLRRTSIDELPQLINVLKGDMSIVGPRPEMPFIVETYKDWQRRRLDVKPGITGLWQILGRKDLPLHENLEYDFYYIKNRSILLDLTILIKTFIAVLFQKGAY